jgi:Domain of Unknown Function (DUF748)
MSLAATKRILFWLITAIAVVVASLFVLSSLLNPIVRSRVERAMNAKLKGYRTRVASAHLQLVGGTLTLRGISIIQLAYPQPPVGTIPMMRIHVQWHEAIQGKVVADLELWRPKLHVNLLQLRAEHASKVPLKNKGWQDAVQNIYPFKINRFRLRDGDITYIDTDPNRPLRLTDLYLEADNIRNVRATGTHDPSPFWLQALVFGQGHAQIAGRANFLAEPSTTYIARYDLKHIPLDRIRPEAGHFNLDISGGELDSDGWIEYTPRIRRANIHKLSIGGVKIQYTHMAPTAGTETQRIKAVKKKAQSLNNAPETLTKVETLDIANSEFSYVDKAKDPPYELFLSSVNGRISNFSNRFAQGPAHVQLHGRFMGSGDTNITALFRPEKQGPDFDLNLAEKGADLRSLNDLLRAYGRFDVASGQISVYSQITVAHGEISGYVKPLFANLKVYNPQKDKGKPLLRRTYEMAIGAAAKLLKNESTKRVATKVNISGRLKGPNVNTWQALEQLVQNAFVQAILPGFDRQASSARRQ